MGESRYWGEGWRGEVTREVTREGGGDVRRDAGDVTRDLGCGEGEVTRERGEVALETGLEE